jgi:hypothetical protein
VVRAHGLRSAPSPSSASMSAYPLCHLPNGMSYLGDAERSPFLLPQQLQCVPRGVEVVLGDDLEHLLGELHVTVLVRVVGVSIQPSVSDASTAMAATHLAE